MSLTDPFGRTIRYLRVSVTDRCNLQCDYCRVTGGTIVPNRGEILTLEEIARLCRLFIGLGIDRIRLTGGEPLLRRNLLSLVEALAREPGLTELSLTTNALLLARFANALQAAGLKRVNISLDTLNPEIFARITRGGDLAPVLEGIDAAVAAGLQPVKINMVVMRGINEHEIPDMVAFAVRRDLTLRFIETMPVGEAGTSHPERFVEAGEILERIRVGFGGDLVPVERSRRTGSGPARYFRVEGSGAEVGIISARSRHFCDTCNRMRLTSRGALVLCLGAVDRVDLKSAMRAGASDAELAELVRGGVAMKPEGHRFAEEATRRPTLGMSSLGG